MGAPVGSVVGALVGWPVEVGPPVVVGFPDGSADLVGSPVPVATLVATAGVTLAPPVPSELVSPASVGWLPRSRATSETTWSGPGSADG